MIAQEHATNFTFIKQISFETRSILTGVTYGGNCEMLFHYYKVTGKLIWISGLSDGTYGSPFKDGTTVSSG